MNRILPPYLEGRLHMTLSPHRLAALLMACNADPPPDSPPPSASAATLPWVEVSVEPLMAAAPEVAISQPLAAPTSD